MLPINRLPKNGIFGITFLLFYAFCITQYAIANDSVDRLNQDIQKDIQSLILSQYRESKESKQYLTRAIRAFNETQKSDNEEVKKALRQWDDHIKSVSLYSNSDYVDALDKQLTDYYKAIDSLGKIISVTKANQKSRYSSSWADDLANHFGKEFIKKNKTAIKWSLMAISASDKTLERKLKDLIYIETMLFGSYEDYFRKFLTFYNEKLDQNAQKNMEAHKNVAQSFLTLIDKVSLISMHNTTVLHITLSENKARQLNNEVFTFLKKHPLSHTFKDIARLLEDLEKVIIK